MDSHYGFTLGIRTGFPFHPSAERQLGTLSKGVAILNSDYGLRQWFF